MLQIPGRRRAAPQSQECKGVSAAVRQDVQNNKTCRQESRSGLEYSRAVSGHDDPIKQTARTGVVGNMTLEEFKAARRCRDKMVIMVSNHKTGPQAPAQVVMNKEDYKLCKDYEQIRSKLSFPKDSKTFVTTGGLPYPKFNADINVWMIENGYKRGH